MMKIAILGATGWLGGTILREARSRGHEVTAIARTPSKLAELTDVATVTADASDAPALEPVIAGHDAVVAAVTDRSGPDRSMITAAAAALIVAVPRAGVPRLAWVGGGGSLETEPGRRYLDDPGFPAGYMAEALAQAEALELLRSSDESLDWTYLSPPPHNLVPGEKEGGFRVQAGDQPVLDGDGHDRLSAGDLAAALVDELEQHRFSRQRFTAGY
jgi:putative NADH-flavin reductase